MHRILSLVLALACAPAGAAAADGVPRGLRPFLVAVSVADLDASARWYEEVLGLQLVEKKVFDREGLKVAFLKSEGFRLELVELRGSTDPARCADVSNPAALRGFGKFAFQVDDLAELMQRLARHSVPILHDFRKAPVAGGPERDREGPRRELAAVPRAASPLTGRPSCPAGTAVVASAVGRHLRPGRSPQRPA